MAIKKDKEVRKKFFYDLLTNSFCKDCGMTDPRLLTFDHRVRSTKYRDVSSLVSSHSLKILKNEINKCDIVCRNCHFIRELKRDNNPRLNLKTRIKWYERIKLRLSNY